MDRREVIVAGISALAALPLNAQDKVDPEKGVTAPEDLMKEHGVLNRCLLIYEEAIRQMGEKQAPATAFLHTAELIRLFVEQYHEKNEEKYIFPVFKKAGKLTGLVRTLETQHKAGRAITGRIIHLAGSSAFQFPTNRQKVVEDCLAFINMYRPHEAREDTVLFPALRTILTPKQVESLGDRMEEDEQKVLGHEGYEKAVAKVEAIEKQLGIYDLAKFTPH